MSDATPYDRDLDQNAANYQALTPISFLERAASVFPKHKAIVHGDRVWTYDEFYARTLKLASALEMAGVKRGDTVSVMLPNAPAMIEAHYGVPMTGGVLNTLNTRLDPAMIAFMIDHAESKVLIVDREFSPTIKAALAQCQRKPLVIDYDDPVYSGPGERIGSCEYEEFLNRGEAGYQWRVPGNEWDALSLNYTSGTTGDPKGVVFHHRGAYLISLNNIAVCRINKHPVYLWIVPMFHCNGWCYPWTISVMAGTHICLRTVRADAIYKAIADHGVTHMTGAPIVMATMLNAPDSEKKALPHTVEFITGGAPPPEAVLTRMRSAGFNVSHVYGLTETYGPSTINEWNAAWTGLDPQAYGTKAARQGVRYHSLEGLEVMDPETMQPVPRDGKTIGEIMLRGNVIMKGYLKNPSATKRAFEGGWFHSGDLGVMHPDGYIQIKDRSKDIIISGGENISSIEVEDVLYKHPAVQAVAVVAKADEKWGETPCAVVELKPGSEATGDELRAWCRERMAGYKCPRHFVFSELPRTSTGKIQKFKLRDLAATT